MNYTKHLRSNGGFAVLQVIVTAGIVAIIGYAVTQIATSSILAQKKAETSADYNTKMSEMSSLFSSSISCTALLQQPVGAQYGAMISGGADINNLNMAGAPVLAVSANYGAVRILGIQVQIEPAAQRSMAIGGQPHTVHRGQVRISTGPLNPALGLYLNKESEHTLLFTINDATNALNSCYTEAADTSVVETSCLMMGGAYEGGRCELGGSPEIVRLRNATELLNISLVEANTRMNAMASDISTFVLDSENLLMISIKDQNVDLANLRRQTEVSFSITAARLSENFANLKTLQNQHVALTEDAANLNTDIEANNTAQKVSLNSLTDVVNVNDAELEAMSNTQNTVLNTLENTMIAKGTAQQVAVNQLENTVNINKTNLLAVKNEINNKMVASGQARQEALNVLDSNVQASHADTLTQKNTISNKLVAQGQSQQELSNLLESDVNLEQVKQLEVNNEINNQIKATGNARVRVRNNLSQTINTSKEAVKASLDQLSAGADAQNAAQQAVNNQIKAKLDANDAAATAALQGVNNGVNAIGNSLTNIQNTTGNLNGQLSAAVNTINNQSALKGQLNGLQGTVNNLSGQLSALGR